MTLRVLTAGPGVTVQDIGRPGYLDIGLGRGGAMDRQALIEGAALLGQSAELAALEMAGFGAEFGVEADVVIALTGASMRVSCDGVPLAWATSHQLRRGQTVSIGAAIAGNYGYLHLAGGIDAPLRLGARAVHLAAGLGVPIQSGDLIAAGQSQSDGTANLTLEAPDRFRGGELRILATAQTAAFSAPMRARLARTQFSRDPRSNRQAIRLAFEGDGFAAASGLSVLSEVTQPGDIQVTGDGQPLILMAEAQTTGGYPRIATILPCDLPRAAQAPAGAAMRLRWIGLDEGLAAERQSAEALPAIRPLLRDPKDMSDLLSFSLIDGVVDGRERNER
ncbi:MAG: urea amidolyase [Pseudomonadota bacterium]